MKQRFNRLPAMMLAATLLAASAAQAAPTKNPFPSARLDKHERGEAAIKALGATLPSVAAWYGKSPSEFARLIREDRDMWLDTRGRVYFVDEGMAVPEQGTTATGTASTAAATLPLDQTFQLHSRPGASRVIYLNFVGGTVSGTAWNSSYGVTSIVAPPYDIDGIPSSFSTTELQNIQSIWQRVAEDYAHFYVDVTTELPLPDALTRTSTSDTTFGTTVMVTRDWTAGTAKPCGCGGFAYLGVFDDTNEYYKPAWVFLDRLGNGNEKYVAEAISHEAGHNLGLNHDGYNDGTTVTGYYQGAGTWAPIMGVGYYKALTQWSKGEYPYATNTEDDLAVIQTYGLPLVADDHGNDFPTATPLTSTSAGGVQTLSGAGVINTRGDVDVFRLVSSAGPLSLSVLPYEKGPNLDVGIALYDASGALVAASTPTDRLTADISLASVAAGVYYLVVDGTANGDLVTGYSDYASLGRFTIAGTAPDTVTTGSPPVAQLTATPVSGTAPLVVNFSSSGSYDPDGTPLTYGWNFGDGTTSTAANPSRTYGTPGSYVATLVVTDGSGRSSSPAQTTISVAPAPAVAMHVENIAMGLIVKTRSSQATATVVVLDSAGKAVSGATVTGQWSGLVSKAVSGVTATNGSVKFTSPQSSQRGTFTFTVTGIGRTGFSYDSTANKETSDFIVR